MSSSKDSRSFIEGVGVAVGIIAALVAIYEFVVRRDGNAPPLAPTSDVPAIPTLTQQPKNAVVLPAIAPTAELSADDIQATIDAAQEISQPKPTRTPHIRLTRIQDISADDVEATAVAEEATAEAIAEGSTNAPVVPAPPSAPVVPSAPLPANYACPYRSDGRWLSVPNLWYGPFDHQGINYAILYNTTTIYVWDSQTNQPSWNPDPATYGQRNQWVRFMYPSGSGSPFLICVDTNGLVFIAFVPE
jgi:hypothetical protein